MIYQLLRRDPVWKLAPFAALGGGLCMWARPGNTGLSWFGSLLYVFLSLTNFRRRATLFQAALPIPARDLFATRCLAFAALVWFPVLAAVSVAFVKGDAVLGPIDCGASASLLIIAVLSIRLTEIDAPYLIVAFLSSLGLGLGVLAFGLLPAAPVLAFCAIASAALFIRAWRAMPESFQVAPLEAQGPSRRRLAMAAPAVPWLFLLRSTVPLPSLFFVPMACRLLSLNTSSWPLLCVLANFIAGPVQQPTHWLYNLPIAKSKLLAITAFAATLFVVAPYGVCVALSWGGHTSFRLALINVICIAAVIMGELILSRAWASRQVRRLPSWFRSGVFLPLVVLIFLALSAAAWFSPLRARSGDFLNAAMLDLSRQLPANEAAVATAGAVLLAALFWLLEKLDAQAEWPELFGRAPGGAGSLGA
jgi:hypothetical protein